MCGRATLTVPAEEVAKVFDVDAIDIGPPRFNLAPTQALVTLRVPRGRDDAASARELALVRWGLIPWWSKPADAKKMGARCVQARAETAPRTPAFRDAFERHRCLVVVDGFYEWKTLPDGRRVPYHVRRTDRAPFAIAGLWDGWKTDGTVPGLTPMAGPSGPGDRVESAAVLTTSARDALADVHDRMPVVLPREDWDRWLHGDRDEAKPLLRRGSTDELVVVPVSTWVNDVKHDDAACVAPADPEAVVLGIRPARAARPAKKRARSSS